MKHAKPQIQSLRVTGFKSLRDVDVELTPLNLLIGANGAGKSNLASLFEFLAASLDGRLDGYVGRNGGPNTLLFQGAKTTDALEVEVKVKTDAGNGTLRQRCGFKPPDSLFYDIRPFARNSTEWANEMIIDDICSVSKDIYSINKQDREGHPGQLIYESLKSSNFRLHLLDTSLTSLLRTECYIEDNKRLRWDGGNLAAMLYYYKSSHHKVYDRIRSTIRKIVPGFDTFEMEPQRTNPRNILLNWKQKGSDYLLGPHQISDGSLRVMVLVTLLLQPEETLPDLIILDEPELGLHPHAITMIGGLIRAAAVNSQLLVCTQSPTFLDEFSPEEVIVAKTRNRESKFQRLDEESLTSWLDEYSLGELWQKNVFGGGPV